ncbi:DUF1385 domain-containing protein [soil metagenome]
MEIRVPDHGSQGSGAASGAGFAAGPIGGQALIEGVMMRRGTCWGAAVRRTDGSIATVRRELPEPLDAVRRLPLLRGVVALGESVALGTRAMLWAAREREDATEDGTGGYSRSGLALSTLLAVTLALGLFGLFPGAAVKAVGIEGRFAFSFSEGLLRLGMLVGYMWLLSRSRAMRRVFAYHGAEHMTIHAFEHGVALESDEIRRFDRRHPRCGTSFLLLVAITAAFVHVLVGTPSWPVLVASRILGLPVVAAVAYEVIRYAGRHQATTFGRVLMAPGSWLQSLTTREPDDDQI